LRIVNGDACTLGQEITNERDGGRFPGVAGVGLEGKAENGNVLAKKSTSGEYHKWEGGYLICDGVEKGVDDAFREATLLVFVQGDDLAPICCHFGKVKTLGKVNEVENVFLETRATEPDRGPQKLGPDARVTADGMRDFLNVGARRLAYGRECVDRRDTLGQHGIGC
jgi:hypothetical protein